MTCSQHINGVQILYNIHVSVCGKYLINVVLGVNFYNTPTEVEKHEIKNMSTILPLSWIFQE